MHQRVIFNWLSKVSSCLLGFCYATRLVKKTRDIIKTNQKIWTSSDLTTRVFPPKNRTNSGLTTCVFPRLVGMQTVIGQFVCQLLLRLARVIMMMLRFFFFFVKPLQKLRRIFGVSYWLPRDNRMYFGHLIGSLYWNLFWEHGIIVKIVAKEVLPKLCSYLSIYYDLSISDEYRCCVLSPSSNLSTQPPPFGTLLASCC